MPLFIFAAVAGCRAACGATVETAGADDIPPLRPIRPEIPPGFYEQYGGWVWAGAILLVALALAAVWWFRRPRPLPSVPPEAAVRAALEPLSREPEDGAVLSRVSQAFRRYVAAAFDLGQGEMTTGDVTRAVGAAPQLGEELPRQITGFLARCDERKFAPPTGAVAPLGAASEALRLVDAAEARRAELRAEAAGRETDVNRTART